MPRADALLYVALLRTARRFRAERLPLVGVAGTDLVAPNLDWQAAARRQLEAPPPGAGLAEGAQLLGRLGRQLDTLLQAEEHTRDMLAEWAALVDTFRPRLRSAGSLLPAAAAETTAAAAEAGLALLTRQSLELADPLQLDLAAAAEAEAAAAGDAPAAVTLDGLATAMRQQHPSLFAADSRADDVRDVDVQLRQVAALWDTLHRQQRFKHEPFEWVYEGLQPLLLPPLLRRRKLAPLTLSVVLAAVARRLGLALLPAPAEGGDAITAAVEEGVAGGAAAHSQLPLEQLRPDVAQRYAGRTQGMAPAAAPWVLLLPAATGGGGGAPSWTHVVDACTGEALALTAVQQRFPELQLAADWRLLGPLVAWQHMVRLMIQAHQRRGESDLVAHWVYVLLALDPQAAEWEFMLHAGAPAAAA